MEERGTRKHSGMRAHLCLTVQVAYTTVQYCTVQYLPAAGLLYGTEPEFNSLDKL